MRDCTHKTCEPFECPRNASLWIHFNENVSLGVHVDLDSVGLVERRVEHCHELLVDDIGSVLGGVLVMLLPSRY